MFVGNFLVVRKGWQHTAYMIIDFLLLSNESDYLFETICKQFDKFGVQNQFFLALRPFFRNRKIKSIPSEALQKKILNYYLDVLNDTCLTECVLLNL